jgi:uncharacterized radical SAM protein YgiQ
MAGERLELAASGLFSHRRHWASRFGVAPFLPMSRLEMDELGWDACDIILVTGDAYVDHPSFGMALIGRLLEERGFRVGIISQPDWRDVGDFQRLGRPNLFFGVTSGNMDSMVNRYTADRKLRSDDAYTAGGEGGKRPDRSVVVYAQRAREAFKGVPIVIGGIEASLRRIAHYDYWSDKVRRSILPDSKADLLLYGNAERAVVELAFRLADGEPIGEIDDIRGTALMRTELPDGWVEIDATRLDEDQAEQAQAGSQVVTFHGRAKGEDRRRQWVRLPDYDAVLGDPVVYAHASRVFHLETNPGNARVLVQRHGKRDVWINPPPLPLTTDELDKVYELPYSRAPHPGYGQQKVPAWEMIRFSINIMRGCFGGCTFCSISEHEGRIIQSRSEGSILREMEAVRDRTEGFTGIVSDLGGPTANMYRMRCKDPKVEAACRRLSCVFPDICPQMETSHRPLTRLYRAARKVKGVKRVFVASGLRYDLAVRDPEYIRELVSHHVGGYLKIAPEHTEERPLHMMMKPGIGSYYRFKKLFDRYSKEAGKEQYLIPYFIAAHPGTDDRDMLNLALWLKENGFRPDQVQAFLPTPLAIASAMYHSRRNPLRKLHRKGDDLPVASGLTQRRLHKALLRYHDPKNHDLLRKTLREMGRADLIGKGPKCLVPEAPRFGPKRDGGGGVPAKAKRKGEGKRGRVPRGGGAAKRRGR